VVPEDLQAVAISVMAHRLDSGATGNTEHNGRALTEKIIRTVPVK